MSENSLERSIALATKIASKAENHLDPLEREMRSWPAEFRAIMWETVANIAAIRAKEARDAQQIR